MWLCILIGLSIMTKVHGYGDGNFPESCQSMAPQHNTGPQGSAAPFEVTCQDGNPGEAIKVFLRSKTGNSFKGFMLEARVTSTVDEGQPVGRFILHNPTTTRLLTCNGLEGSAVSQTNNHQKTEVSFDWIAPEPGLDITFRATFVENVVRFWQRVDVNVGSCLRPTTSTTTTTTTTEPSTTTATTETSTTTASTTTTTTEPSTTTATTETSTTTASTTTTTTEPSTTTASTTTTTTEPSTTTATTDPITMKQSPTTSATTPSRTSAPKSTIELSMTTSSPRALNKTVPIIMALTHSDILFVALKMELPIIFTTTLPNSPVSRCLVTVSKILCSLLCAALEISALVLFFVADSFKVTLVALLCVALVINFIELVIACLPFGPSHELKEIFDVALKVCSVIHVIFTLAVVFVGVLEIEGCRENRKDSSLLKMMIAYTVWIFLFVIWVFVFSTHRHAILERRKTGSWRQQRKKEKLSAAEVIVTAVSVIFIFGTMAFTVAEVFGIFSEEVSSSQIYLCN